METLNKGQLEIATDLLSKIDNVIKTNSQNLEDRIFSLTGAAGCVDKDTEFLTENGWKKISEYSDSDRVAQWNKDNKEISFIKPLAYIKQETNGFYHFKGTTTDMLLSAEHRVPIITSRGNPQDKTAKELVERGSSFKIPREFTISPNKKSSVVIPDELLRVLVMQSADGSFSKNKLRIRINVKKEAKRERVLKLLHEANITYSNYNKNEDYKDWTRVAYTPPSEICTKDLSMLWGCDLRQLHIIYDELMRWDGSTIKRKNVSTKSFTGIKRNVDFCQYVMSVCSRKYCTVSKDKREYKFEDIYSARQSSRNISVVELRKWKYKVPFIPSEDGLEYCFTTETGYWLARRNGKIFPTGNCGKTYLTSVLLGELKKRVGKLCLTATTHRALAVVKNIGASHNIESRTIHSYLKCKLKENTHTGTVDLIRDENKAIDLVDVLIVDESSLLSASLFSIIQEEMLKNTIRICIFVGDSAQLLPVEESDNNPIYEGLIECNEYALTEITRQAADSSIIQLATYIRKQIEAQEYKPFSDLEQFILNMNSPEIQVVRKINDFYDEYAKVPFKDSIILAHKNITVNMYNKKARTLEYGKTVSILEGERLVFNSAHTNGEETIHYNNQEVVVKSCELIVDEANDIEYWKVITTEDTLFKVVDYSYKVEFEEKLKEIAREAKKSQGTTKTMLWERYFSLKNTFQDVVYTYASSIYKSQGGSIDYVFVDFNELTGMVRFLSLDDLYRLSYIFVTRAKQKLTIFIK